MLEKNKSKTFQVINLLYNLQRGETYKEQSRQSSTATSTPDVTSIL